MGPNRLDDAWLGRRVYLKGEVPVGRVYSEGPYEKQNIDTEGPTRARTDINSNSDSDERRHASDAKCRLENDQGRTSETKGPSCGQEKCIKWPKNALPCNGLGTTKLANERERCSGSTHKDPNVRKLIEKRRKRRENMVIRLLYVLEKKPKIATGCGVSVAKITENEINDSTGSWG